ncbi:bombesin receptor subtype-3-like [Exaiptasia diaphana]|uniref:G-protein coupled receptors family 1 profile domain-containing protein n=1 Tax=Exaiptasia diaphana TaxID=2652724 RepID=A0A913YMI0_EXADI|nr:bombesin receptor subtype-3-like [Exaiptasia diaphana]
MAVSDTLFLFSSLLENIPWLSNNIWRIYHNGLLGIIECKIVRFIWNTSVRVTLITLLIISVERFRATRQTLQKQRPYTRKQRMIVLGLCWLVPMPFAAFFIYAELPCINQPARKSLVPGIWIHELLVVMCCCVIFALGILTTKRLSKLQPIDAHLAQAQRKARVRRTQAAVRMVITSVSLHSCCTLPLLIFNVFYYVKFVFPSVEIIDFSTCKDWKSISFIMYTFLLVVNSCFSPLIYIVFLPDFKEAAKKVLFRGRETQNQTNETQLSCSQLQTVGRSGQNLSQVETNQN